MSGLAAILRLDGAAVESSEIQRMLHHLEHRGIDDQGIQIEGGVGFGHCMRWSTPESLNEKLPAKSRESSCLITCDARIDNRGDLIRDLWTSEERITAIGDSEIILKAYEKWGTACAEKMLGDFVFVIWDPNERRLFCARDSMGVKHFYYYYKPDRFIAIASEIKALLGLSYIPKRLNETNIGDILIFNHNDKESTPFAGINRLPANHAMTVDTRGLRIWQYWRPASRIGFRYRSNRRFEEEFRSIFAEAVCSRLRSVRLPGSLLSGGLDSSSISCVASSYLTERGSPPLETFSAVFPTIATIDARIDERRYINSVVRRIRCNPNYVEADTFSPFQEMDRLQWHADHPVAAPNVFMDWALFKAAKNQGVGTLLSGFDGDSTVSYGYEAFAKLARQGRWWRLYRDAAALNKNMPAKHHSLKQLVLTQGFVEAAPDFVRQLWRSARGRPRITNECRILPSSMNFQYDNVNAQFAGRHDLRNRYFEATSKTHPDGVSDAESHWNALCSGMFAFALESFEKMGAAFDIETRFPFFDRRLVEFCISLPAHQKVYKGWTRSILRRAMREILPPDIQWRTDKANIGLSYKVNMLKYGREEIENALYGSTKLLEGFVDLKRVRAAYDRYRSDPIKNGREALLITATVFLSCWLNQAFGSRSAFEKPGV